ncbi:hypothetical protein ABT009_46140 [Streptomyces sp. NPDC002896]|uniref:hypothetical protein n=1 Tax=Streptomyces sp. NPDC002896 TaxID=3154438 RepID=UPI003318F983
MRGDADAAAVSALLYLPVGITVLWHRPLTLAPLAYVLPPGCCGPQPAPDPQAHSTSSHPVCVRSPHNRR